MDDRDDAPPSNRRRFFRLRYPERDRPLLAFKRLELPVAELSEGGARLVVDDLTLSRHERIAADIRFADGAVFGVVGTVIRHEGDEAVLKLDFGIPLRRMLSEQKWVYRDYPGLADADREAM
jgi:PilZ domain